MPQYVQEVLDLIEYANGPVTSTWGAKRAEAGHPEPFKLKYLGIGNEEHITPVFKERFKMIYDAVRAKHPEITVIGTVGPSWRGTDFEEGWKFANELGVAMVDEHYYEQPAWFLSHQDRYDSYDRRRAKVFLGEYASRGNTLANALAEAAYLTALERNGDVVQFSSYAPLLAKHGHIHWYPDLIYFNNTNVFPSVSYYVQQLFGNNAGTSYIASTTTQQPASAKKDDALAVSCVRDEESGDLIIKIVNVTNAPIQSVIELAGPQAVNPNAKLTVLTGDPSKVNPGDPRARDSIASTAIIPRTVDFKVGRSFPCELPASSLTVLRLISN
jgi:alpha-L-arabinofuranosidase